MRIVIFEWNKKEKGKRTNSINLIERELKVNFYHLFALIIGHSRSVESRAIERLSHPTRSRSGNINPFYFSLSLFRFFPVASVLPDRLTGGRFIVRRVERVILGEKRSREMGVKIPKMDGRFAIFNHATSSYSPLYGRFFGNRWEKLD